MRSAIVAMLALGLVLPPLGAGACEIAPADLLEDVAYRALADPAVYRETQGSRGGILDLRSFQWRLDPEALVIEIGVTDVGGSPSIGMSELSHEVWVNFGELSEPARPFLFGAYWASGTWTFHAQAGWQGPGPLFFGMTPQVHGAVDEVSNTISIRVPWPLIADAVASTSSATVEVLSHDLVAGDTVRPPSGTAWRYDLGTGCFS